MTHTLLRAGALSCALLASTCLTGPALAQSGAPTPPPFTERDANGVDLARGTFSLAIPVASIGAGAEGLALVNYFGAIQQDNWNIRFRRSESGANATITITLGDRSETFTGPKTATSFASDQGSGATLTKVSAQEYLYVAADGTRTPFAWPNLPYRGGISGFCAPGNELSCSLLAGTASSPTGRTLSFSWRVGENCTSRTLPNGEIVEDCAHFYRLAGATNNSGYGIGFVYENDVDPTSGLPPTSWHRRTGATLSNQRVAGTPIAIAYSNPAANVTEIGYGGVAGRVWRITGDSNGYVVGVRRPGSPTDNLAISYTGPTTGIVSSVVADGIATTYAFAVTGANQATMTVTNALSQQTTIVSDTRIGRPTAVTDPLNRTTEIAYDASGRPTRITAPEDNYTEITYDSRGNVLQTQAVAKPGSPEAAQPITTSATFAASCSNAVTCNRPTSTTDARGNVTDYEYDPVHGGVTRITAPAAAAGAFRPQTRLRYAQAANGAWLLEESSACQTLPGASGAVPAACLGTADEVRTAIRYDVNNLPDRVTTGSGNLDPAQTATQEVAYDAHGNAIRSDGPLAGADDTAHRLYDHARRPIGTISPDPDGAGPLRRRAVRTTYRPDDQASLVESGNADGTSLANLQAMSVAEAAETRFVGAFPVSSRLNAGGSTRALTVLGYDPLGRVECTAQRMDPALFGTDTDACLQNSQNGTPDRITKTIRDPAGQVTEVRTAVGTALEAPEVRTTYTANGQVESLTDAEFNHTVYFFDGHDRLRRTQYPVWQRGAGASNPAHYDERTYDPAGNVLTFRNRAGEVTSFSYDALGRLTLRDRPAGASEVDVSYGYDLLGRRLHAWGNYGITFTWDALGRQLTETNPHGTIASQYDAAGRRTRLTYPTGPGYEASFFVTYDYLTTGEMRTIRENGATSGIGVLATFGYDDLGRRTSLTRGNGIVTSYGYDPASRLQTLAHNFGGNGNDVTLSFGHNAAAQITSRSGMHNAYAFTSSVAGTRTDTHNGRNEIATVNGTTVTHDARGNLTNDGFRSFGYTSDNLMTQAGGAALYYDPLDRLRFVQGGGNEQRVYDGPELIMELDMNGTALLRRYVHGPGVDEPLVWYEGSGTADRRWLTADERGSIIGTFNDARSGLGYVAYDEYGRRQVLGTPGRFGFTGQQWLPEIGMYYFRARMYDPDGSRFPQTDPIGYGDGMNLYAYVRGDPVNRRDPTGTGPTANEPDEQFEAEDNPIIVTGTRPRQPKTTYGSPPRLGPATPLRFDRDLLDRCAGSISLGGNSVALDAADLAPCPDGATREVSGRQSCAVSEARSLFRDAASTAHGQTIGNNPRWGGSRYNTGLPGGARGAYRGFHVLTRAAGELPGVAGILDSPLTFGVSSEGSIRLRLGVDFDFRSGVSVGLSYRIDIRANTFSLTVPETIHFTDEEDTQCPIT